MWIKSKMKLSSAFGKSVVGRAEKALRLERQVHNNDECIFQEQIYHSGINQINLHKKKLEAIHYLHGYLG